MTTEEFMDQFEGVSPPTEEQKRCLEAAMEEHKRLIKEAEIERREGPKRRFFEQGLAAGFSSTQLKFMWRTLAQADHEHWDGRIG